MATKAKVQNGGFPARIRRLRSQFYSRLVLIKSRWTARKHIKNMKTKKQGLTQAEQFVQSRNATLQYAIDVLALAFILALIFTAIRR